MPLQPRLVREAQAPNLALGARVAGAEQLINYFVGQVVGSMKHIRPARRVIEEMAQEYADTMERLDAWAEGKND